MQASLSSASSLIALQLVSRLFTFGLNQAMLRLASPEAFGTAAIQFELMLSTILFLSREGVRNALLRAWPSRIPAKDADQIAHSPGSASSSSVTNVAFLPLILGLPFAVATSFLYANIAGDATRNQAHFQLAVSMYAAAAVMELLSEPMHNRWELCLQSMCVAPDYLQCDGRDTYGDQDQSGRSWNNQQDHDNLSPSVV
jgi:oligosaccharide translocation protein RFT1